MLNKIRSFIFPGLLESIFWRYKKLPVTKKYKEYSELQWSSKLQLDERQSDKLRKLLIYAFDVIPFYKKLSQKLNVHKLSANPWSILKTLPIVEKKYVNENISDFFVEAHLGTIKNSTGGSTGEPVVFLQDRVFKTATFATTMLFYEWAGRKPGNLLIKLWGAERDLVKGGYGVKQKLIDFIGNRVTINAFRMSPERMSEYINIINAKKPKCIEGYAESLYELSRFIEGNKLTVFSPEGIVSSAGTLFPHMRDQIEQAFHSSVFDRYGSREAGNMAAECHKHNGLHVFSETTILEIVDDEGNEVNVGEEGEILVTNLTNYTMPLIRYRIGDRAIKGASQCGCGRPYPLLQKIVGRSSSSFKTREGGVVSPEFFIHAVGVMLNEGEIEKFQVIQESLDMIVVLIVLASSSKHAEWSKATKLKEIIRKAMGSQCDVEIQYVDDIEKTATGKHLYTVSKVV